MDNNAFRSGFFFLAMIQVAVMQTFSLFIAFSVLYEKYLHLAEIINKT